MQEQNQKPEENKNQPGKELENSIFAHVICGLFLYTKYIGTALGTF